MLKGVTEFGKQLFALTRDVQQSKTDINEIREEMKELREEFSRLREDNTRLTRIVERLAFEMQKERESAAQERRILLLEIDNRFLRFERELPPGKIQNELSE